MLQKTPCKRSSELAALLKQCSSLQTFKQIHTQLLKNSIHAPNFLLSKIVDLKNLPYAILLFAQNPHPNDFSYNVMIRGLSTTWGEFGLALEFFRRMKYSDQKPNKYTYPFVLIACGSLPCLDSGRITHSSVWKAGLDSDGHVQHSLITMYARCGELGAARKVFDEIAERDVVSWNSLISGYARLGLAVEAVELFGRMREEEFVPDEMTLVSVLNACGDLGDAELGRWIEGFVEENKIELTTYIVSSLIAMHAKCGDFKSARRVFDGMLRREVVVWNAMITGYAQNGMSNEAIKLFNTMRGSSIVPDKITLVGVLPACGSVGALELGMWIDAYASRKGLQHNIYVGTSLIDMYAKCGNLDRALEIFEDMPCKNEVCWNAMITGLAFHGRGPEAISMFKRMLDERKWSPNDITFIAVLSACVHAGMVDEGCHWFESMQFNFNIVPKIEHYSCMVDLLARSGQLEEAYEFIEKIPRKPDAIVLGALLGACRNLKNVNVGERVIHKLLELDPSNSANYIISSKIYAGSNRWDDSAKMRRLMRERGVAKTPGCSWIDIGSEVHEFLARDDLHPKYKQIYEVIEILYEEMIIEGYIPMVED